MTEPITTLGRASERDLRLELEQKVRLDLLGPAGGPNEEIAEDRVSDRYLVGMLAPAGEILAAEEMDRLGEGRQLELEDGKADEATHGKSAFLPSSIGMTFIVSGNLNEIRVHARWGRYVRTYSEADPEKTVWKRLPVEGSSSVLLRNGRLKDWSPDAETPEVIVQGIARKTDHWIVTLFLVNGQEPKKKKKDEACLFQVELEVLSDDGSACFFRRRPENEASTKSEEQAVLDMAYRGISEFAVGHGVAVHAEQDRSDALRAVRLKTEIIPTYELPAVSAPEPAEIPLLGQIEADMKLLSEITGPEVNSKLGPLADAYDKWIQSLETEIAGNPALQTWKQPSSVVVGNCRRALSRIQEGIQLLQSNSQALQAFQFMNRAMWLQRIHSKLSESVRRGQSSSLDKVDLPENRSWRPFQLAFILINLPSLTDVRHPDRSADPSAIVDLLWYPTGGGKTEAYLGVSAYVMAIRRLQGTVEGRSGEYGVAVLMRYTLRLLTVQQFQRAATLMCACEAIRKEALERGEAHWGAVPFRIGLWVGKGVTPNTTDQSYEAIRTSHGDNRGKGFGFASSGSPYQLVSCPWCGTKMNPGRDIDVERFSEGRARTIQYCGDTMGNCVFSRRNSLGEGLPIVVVDEEIYRNLPTLVIATADKFAQMPWKGEIQTLFGVVDGACQRHGFRSPELEDTDSHPKTRNGKFGPARTVASSAARPPDLIIQDELHLISGPLGTLVGLYETAIDSLCSWEVAGKAVRPKLIASTATIRQAAAQVRSLYARQVQIFPPSGLNVEDNFFSRQRKPSDENPGRVYFGICAQGRRMKAALIRVYAALLSAAQNLHEEYGDRCDPWMTVVGYFNSLRELGGTRRILDDDIAARLKRMDRRGLSNRRLYPTGVEELTSRKSSTEIPQLLDRLEISYSREGRDHLDVVLATNMVSVGVDVARLGLMAVCGQPKTTSEYIQATSRVGRHHPGLVVTIYNWARPRDLSHYERFEYYHATFYRHVEALSVTPFSPRALDRGLVAVLVSLIRLGSAQWNANGAAAAVLPETESVQRAVAALVRRARETTGKDDVAEAVQVFVQRRLEQWVAIAKKASGAYPLGYDRTASTAGLLQRAGEDPWGEFTCLNSLRDVESTVGLILRDDERLDYPPEFETQTVKEEEANEAEEGTE